MNPDDAIAVARCTYAGGDARAVRGKLLHWHRIDLTAAGARWSDRLPAILWMGSDGQGDGEGHPGKCDQVPGRGGQMARRLDEPCSDQGRRATDERQRHVVSDGHGAEA